jgi:hypothetical protein
MTSLSDETIEALETHATACDEARDALEQALREAGPNATDDADTLQTVAEALGTWRDAQQRFMDAVETSEAPDVATAAMLLKMNAGIDATNARRGLPGAHVEGTDQPFDLDLSGKRGSVLTTAATEYLE